MLEPEKWDPWNAVRVNPSNRNTQEWNINKFKQTNQWLQCLSHCVIITVRPNMCVLEAKNVHVCLFSKSPQVHLGSAQVPAGVLDTRGWAGAKPHCCLQMNGGTWVTSDKPVRATVNGWWQHLATSLTGEQAASFKLYCMEIWIKAEYQCQFSQLCMN